MSFRSEIAQRGTHRERRRGVRVNSRVPVVIEWEGDGGQAHRQEACTRIIGPYGCLAVTPESLNIEQRVRVTNLSTGESNPAVVVWKGSQRAEGWEQGIELIQPSMGFWGLEL